MQTPSPSSQSSPSSSLLRLGTFSVTVPAIGGPEIVPSGIRDLDPVPPMVDTRSSDMRRLEDLMTKSMADMLAKLSHVDRRREESDKQRDQSDSARDRGFNALREEFVALQVQQNEIMSRLVTNGLGNSVDAAAGSNSRNQYFSTRQSKVDFPIFSGDDLAGWILRCDHFFTVDLTPEDSKVLLAVINFAGRALQWYQNWTKYQPDAMSTPWRLFLQALEGRFGDHLLGDPMTELLSLRQTGSFADYHDRFELLLGRVTISESYAISHFINGLRPYVQKAVRLFMPQTLVHAYALARLQEMSSSGRDGFSPAPFPKKPITMDNRTSNSTPLLPSPSPMPAVKNTRLLTQEEMNDLRARGLCFSCHEKFERGHRCPKKQLFLLELVEEAQEEDVDYAKSGGKEDPDDENPLISFHAINGSVTRGYKTMRVTGRVGRREVHILIDSGSTHNFLDVHLAKKLGLQLSPVKTVMVDVADGYRLECDSMCKNLKWNLQNSTFTTDVLLLPLGNCDMVLGIQWLETLGVIKWNFKNLTMDFQLLGKRHVLRGIQQNQKVQTISERCMDKILTQGQGAQLCCIRVSAGANLELSAIEGSEHQSEQETHPHLQSFLSKHQEVFEEPTAL